MWDDHGTRRRPPIAPLSHQLEDKERNVSSLFGAPNICGKPMASRAESVNAMRYLCGELTASTQSSDAPLLSHVFGEGPLVLSDIPLSCCQSSSGAAGETTGGVVAGIDEAGRGSVLGPMVYGMAFWHPTVEEAHIPSDFNDSKQLTEPQRESLFERILETSEMGFAARVLPASEISRNMLRREPNYNLNQMSHDAAMAMIRALLVQANGVKIQTCYIDTVGNPESYTRRLEREFPGIEFIVESKADDKYAPCSAASIEVAKVVRDRIMANWRFSEPALANVLPVNFGSGYPSDPICKAWLQDNLSNNVFGFADVVRFSWGPVKKQLTNNDSTAVAVTFLADDEAKEDVSGDGENKHLVLLGKKRQQDQMCAFLSGKQQHQKRLPYFEERKLEIVTKLP